MIANGEQMCLFVLQNYTQQINLPPCWLFSHDVQIKKPTVHDYAPVTVMQLLTMWEIVKWRYYLLWWEFGRAQEMLTFFIRCYMFCCVVVVVCFWLRHYLLFYRCLSILTNLFIMITFTAPREQQQTRKDCGFKAVSASMTLTLAFPLLLSSSSTACLPRQNFHLSNKNYYILQRVIITFCVRKIITFCVEVLLHFVLGKLLHFVVIVIDFDQDCRPLLYLCQLTPNITGSF